MRTQLVKRRKLPARPSNRRPPSSCPAMRMTVSTPSYPHQSRGSLSMLADIGHLRPYWLERGTVVRQQGRAKRDDQTLGPTA